MVMQADNHPSIKTAGLRNRDTHPRALFVDQDARKSAALHENNEWARAANKPITPVMFTWEEGSTPQRRHDFETNQTPRSEKEQTVKDVQQWEDQMSRIESFDDNSRKRFARSRKNFLSSPNLLEQESIENETTFLGAPNIPSLGVNSAIPSVSRGAISCATSTPIKSENFPIYKMKRSKSEQILLSPAFRTRLMNEQNERNPLFYYKVFKTIGTGSMGSVALVKKRSQTAGGSARKGVREAVRTHKRRQKCFQLPFGIGGLFRLCMEDELRVAEGSSDHPQGKDKPRRGGKNALLSIETWLGFSEDGESSGVSSCASSSSALSEPESTRKKLQRQGSSFLSESSGMDASEYSFSSAGRSGLDNEYAMKSIHLNRVTDETFVEELKNEIDILKSLDHPHIVRPIETYHYKDQIFIVMEHCSGGDLYSRDPYTEEEAARIISSILSAVTYLHANNIAHRDLKYENILFVNNSPKSDIKLIDFGLSKVYGTAGVGDGTPETLTEGVGTIYTMAPEVLKGSYTKQADVWSVGVIAYMLLSSQMPFYGRKRQHIVQQILAVKFDFKGRRWRRVGAPAKDFVTDLLMVDPDERLDAEKASSCVWLNKRFSVTERGPEEVEILQAKRSMTRYAGYTKLKKMALMVVAHRSTSEEIGVLRKMFQKYASKHKAGCISYDEFNEAWTESGLPAQDTRAIFDAVDLDGTGRIRYTEFLAATIEAQGAISEGRLAEAFDRFDTDDTGFISVDNLTDVLGKDFPRQEIIDILDDAIDPNLDGNSGTRVSYSAFLQLWENNQEKMVRENKIRMLGSQLNLAGMDDDDNTYDTLNSSGHSIESQEVAKARATFLMDKHETLGTFASRKLGVGDTIFEDTMITIAPTMSPQMNRDSVPGVDDYSMSGGIQI
mmetsp:Transcript_16016/g.37107  ORF Transcript_16016/g.37107 Transcript_16016/m.37107 type:complete len:896 (-) Transcript_16016:313-3000(-)